MNNIEYSIDQHGTLHTLEDVSRFYPSAVDSRSSLNRPMGERIGLASTSCLAGYSQPVYTAPYLTTESATYAIGDIFNSAYLQGDGRISEDLVRAHTPNYDTMAYNTSPAQLQDFGNPWPKEIKSAGRQPRPEDENLKWMIRSNCKRIDEILQELHENRKPHNSATVMAILK